MLSRADAIRIENFVFILPPVGYKIVWMATALLKHRGRRGPRALSLQKISSGGRAGLPWIGTAEIEAALVADRFAAVGVELGGAVGTEHGGVAAGLRCVRGNVLATIRYREAGRQRSGGRFV